MDALTHTATVSDIINKRKSTVAFSGEKIDQEQIGSLFEAARLAPSAYNEQPWRFIYADKYENPDGFEKLAALLVPANHAWAAEAPLLILAGASTILSINGKPNYHAHYDTGQAVAFLTLQATSAGLYMHQMGGFDREKSRELFGTETIVDPLVMIAVGYKKSADLLPENLKARELQERKRKEIGEIVNTI